jgi:pSer/pThr/pTyr-binding forkhead associated (FHA) protein
MEEATGTPLPQPLPQGEGRKINSSPSGGGWVGVTSPSPSATVVVQLPSDHITFFHPDGWKLEIHDGDILGRSNGRHTARLGSIPVISGNHAKVTNNGGKWFLTDLNSTNKTYVNTSRLEPNVPIEIKQNDVVTLANVNFTVVV